MTTPTPMKHGASQQGRTPNAQGTAPTPRTIAAATPPVSTPFSQLHAAFSPPGSALGPRSSSQQFKKSPANSSTVVGHTASTTANYDSPSTAAAFNSLNMGDLGLDAVATPAASAFNAAMGSTMSPNMHHSDEDDRLRRLTKVMEILDRFKGHVSEAGLDRLAGRSGLDVLWEDTNTNGLPTRTLMIAGKAVSIDIICHNNQVLDVSLSFPTAPPVVNRHTGRANKILFKNLYLAPGQSPLTKTLDDFAANLERLAALDKLCVNPGLNCHEAIAGIFESLDKLFKWDVEKTLSARPNLSLPVAGAIALSSRHGRPLMHARSRVGMSLAYWKERWMVPPTSSQMKLYSDLHFSTFSMLIGCTKLNGRLSTQGIAYPAVRVSQFWISESVEKLSPSPEETLLVNGPILDWQEPEFTVLPNPEETKEHESAQDALMAGGKFPEVIFTATFDPPLTMPYHDFQAICTAVEEPVQPPLSLETYDSLLFPLPQGVYDEPSQPRKICETKKFRCFAKGTEEKSWVSQRHTLHINKRIYGHTLHEVPFAHPKQLVSIVPVLRQYAMLTTLLENSFKHKSDHQSPKKEAFDDKKAVKKHVQSIGGDLSFFLDTNGGNIAYGPKPEAAPSAPSPPVGDEAAIAVDISLHLHPTPSLKCNFPWRGRTVDVSVEVGQDGVISIPAQNVNLAAEQHAKMAKALQVFCNIGMWVNWVREEIPGPGGGMHAKSDVS